MDFKNVQRRVYDALNVLSAMDIIYKDKYNIIYNAKNDHIPLDFPVSFHYILTLISLEWKLRGLDTERKPTVLGARLASYTLNLGSQTTENSLQRCFWIFWSRFKGVKTACSGEATSSARTDQAASSNRKIEGKKH